MARTTERIQFVRILPQDALVPVLLHFRKPNEKFCLFLRRQVSGNILFHPTKHKWTQDGVQLLDDVVLPVLIVRIEPLVELFAVAKDFGQQKVQQGPKFMQIVLERCSGNQQTKVRVYQSHGLRQTGILVLDPMSLVNDQVLPGNLAKGSLLLQHGFVRANKCIEAVLALLGLQEGITSLRALILGAAHAHSVDRRRPLAKLFYPVPHDGLGDDDNMWACHATGLAKVCQERDGLESLSQSHFVCENTIYTVVVEFDHPIQTLQLILAHFAVICQHFRLAVQVHGATCRSGCLHQCGVFLCLCHTVRLSTA
mmetsp:Transcript_15987/g.36869  ORF Transcript_15987/g.36869 Transcript_15987/m.36869 type:complete len:311 (+) Transcript_15987:781-1713(+)